LIKKKELEIFLSTLKDFESPKENLEQWSTPPDIAAEILFIAYSAGDINDRIIADLGAGTGILGIGAAILGAKKVFCVEIDPNAYCIALENLEKAKRIFDNIDIVFLNMDVRNFSKRVDVVIMNPPFGLEKSTRHADVIFLRKAFEIADKIYSLHHFSSKSRRYLINLARNNGFKGSILRTFHIPLKARKEKHRKERLIIPVDFYVFEKEY